jgi:hypothetical protein
LSRGLAEDQQWNRAEALWREIETIASTIKDQKHRASVLRTLGGDLAKLQQWERAEMIASTVEEDEMRFELLSEITIYLTREEKFEQVLRLVQRAWIQAKTRSDAIKLLPLSDSLLYINPEVSRAFEEAFVWVDTFLKG